MSLLSSWAFISTGVCDTYLHHLFDPAEFLQIHLTRRLILPLLFCFFFLSNINQFFYDLLQVEALHDFEAANTDELTLQRGDVVLVVPSDSEADQVKYEIAI